MNIKNKLVQLINSINFVSNFQMTGLDPDKQTFIEAAIIITDKNLKVLAESPNIIIYQSNEILENMEEWPKKNHALVNS